MRGLGLLATLALTAVFAKADYTRGSRNPTENIIPTECPAIDSEDVTIHLAHENDCTLFYKCYTGSRILLSCPSGLHFNPILQVCDWPDQAGCISVATDKDEAEDENDVEHVEKSEEEDENEDEDKEESDESDEVDHAAPEHIDDAEDTQDTVVEIPTECPAENGDSVVNIAHESSCGKYYVCDHGTKIEMSCAAGLEFNAVLQVCDWPANAGCTLTGTEESEDSGDSGNDSESETEEPTGSGDSNEPSGDDTEETIVIPTECPAEDGEFPVHIAHESDCTLFYKCAHGQKFEVACPTGLEFNAALQLCDWPENAGCSLPGHATDDGSSVTSRPPGNGDEPDHTATVQPSDTTHRPIPPTHPEGGSPATNDGSSVTPKPSEDEDKPDHTVTVRPSDTTHRPIPPTHPEGGSPATNDGSSVTPKPSEDEDKPDHTVTVQPSDTTHRPIPPTHPEGGSPATNDGSSVTPKPSEDEDKPDHTVTVQPSDTTHRPIPPTHPEGGSPATNDGSSVTPKPSEDEDKPDHTVTVQPSDTTHRPIPPTHPEGGSPATNDGSSVTPKPSEDEDKPDDTVTVQPSDTTHRPIPPTHPEGGSPATNDGSSVTPKPSEDEDKPDHTVTVQPSDTTHRPIPPTHPEGGSPATNDGSSVTPKPSEDEDKPDDTVTVQPSDTTHRPIPPTHPEGGSPATNDGSSVTPKPSEDEDKPDHTVTVQPSDTTHRPIPPTHPEGGSPATNDGSSVTPKPSEDEDKPDHTVTVQPSDTTHRPHPPTQPENEVPENTPIIPTECPAVDGDFPVHIAHESDCTLFYKCAHGQKFEIECPAGLEFNAALQLCDWPESAGCSLPGSATNDESSVTPKPSEDEDKPHHTVTVQPSDTTHRPHPPTQPEGEVPGNTPIIPTACPAEDGDFPVHIAHESDCTLFYKCAHGQKFEVACPTGLEFNAALQLCDWPESAGCSLPGSATNDESSVTPKPSEDEDKPHHTVTVQPSDTTHRPHPPTQPEGEVPGNTPIIPTACPAEDGDFPVHIAHESDCTLFYKCAHGQKFEVACPTGLEFNAALQLCDWPESAGCSLPGSATNDESSVTPKPSEDEDKPHHTVTVQPSDTTHRPHPPTQPEGEVPGNTPIIPTACPAEDGDFPVHIAHESDCTLFYKCAHGQKFEVACPTGLEFNAALQLCDWPENAGCSLPGHATDDGSSVTSRPPGNGDEPDHTATVQPSDTTHRPIPPTHPEGGSPATNDGSSVTPKPSEDEDKPDDTVTVQPSDTTHRPIPPTHPEGGSPATNDGSSVTPKPSEDEDKPDHTVTVQPSDTTHRPIPPTHPEGGSPATNDGSSVTPKPSEDEDKPDDTVTVQPSDTTHRPIPPTHPEGGSPATNDGSSVTPKPSEDEDKPDHTVTVQPSDTTHRPIPPTHPEGGSPATNDGSSVTPKPSEDEDKPDHTVTVQPSDTTHRPHPPTQPENEVPENTPIIPTECPAVDGDFPVHIAHESDCTLFYKCAHGQKFEIECPAGLEFNAALQLCDWPESAGCSLPGSATNDESSVTPKPSEDEDKPHHTVTVQPSDTTHRPHPPTQPEGEVPGNTPIIPTACPAEDGDFPVHIAHESDCTLFYKCAHGQKFEVACPTGLEFNAALQLCDWPENAGCSLPGHATDDGSSVTSRPPGNGDEPDHTATVQPSDTTHRPIPPTHPEGGSPATNDGSSVTPKPSEDEDKPDHTVTVRPSDTTHRPIPPTHPEGGSPATNDGSSVTPKPSEDEDKPDHTVTVQPSDTTHRPIPPTHPEGGSPATNDGSSVTPKPSEDEDKPDHTVTVQPSDTTHRPIPPTHPEGGSPATNDGSSVTPKPSEDEDKPDHTVTVQPSDTTHRPIPPTHPEGGSPATNDGSSVTPKPSEDEDKPDDTVTVQPSDTTHRPIPPTHPEGGSPATNDGSSVTPKPSEDEDKPDHTVTVQPSDTTHRPIPPTHPEGGSPATNDGSSVTPKPSEDEDKPDDTVTVQPSDTTHRPIPPTHPEGGSPATNDGSSVTPKPSEDEDKPDHTVTVQPSDTTHRPIPPTHPEGGSPATNDGSSVTPKPSEDEDKPDHTVTVQPSDTTHRPHPPTQPENEVPENTPIIPTECPAVDGDFPVHIAHESDCTLFYKCAHGQKFEIECPAGLEFNAALQLCDWPESAGCSLPGSATNDESSVTPKPSEDEDKPHHTVTVQPSDTTHRPHPPTQPEGEVPGNTPIIPTACPAEDGDFPVHIAHESDCTLFYKCAHGQKFEVACPTGLEFNAALQLCDWPESAGCSLPGSATNDESSVTPKPSEDEDKPHHTVTVQPSDTTHRPHPPTQPEGEVPGNTPIIPTACPAEDGDFPVHIAHESDCTLFYKCAHGQKFEVACPTGLEFNAALQLCDWPESAGCSLPGSATNDESSVTPKPSEDEDKPHHTVTVQPSDTTHRPHPPTQPEGEVPGNTPIIPTACPAEDGDFPVHIAHESDCTLFYKCAHGQKFEVACPTGLEFNAALQLCDWPENAGCSLPGHATDDGSSVTSRPPGNGDEPDHTATVQPSDTTHRPIPPTHPEGGSPATNDGSSVTPKPSEDEDKPDDTVTVQPSDTTHRPIPPTHPEGGSPATNDGSSVTPKPSEDEDKPDHTVTVQPSDTTHRPIPPTHPEGGSPATNDGSSVTPKPSEDEDKPDDTVTVQPSDTTHRPIPPTHPEGGSPATNDGSSVTPKPSEDEDKPDHTVTVQPSDTTHRPIPPTHPEGGSPATNDGSSVTPKPSEDEDKPDHTVTVQPSDTTHRPHPPTQPENEVPENTPIIPTECPAVDGDFPVHIAHESDCTLFYKCAHGQKFEIECPAGLEFNAALQLCDWPESAGCSLPGSATNDESSVTPKPSEDEDKPHHTVTVQPSDTTHRPHPPTQPEGEVPGNTPIIPTACPAEDGDFPVHIAHESDCTLFYKCAHGQKFEVACPTGLEFNAALQLCDWPENAGCSLPGHATDDGSSVTSRPPGNGDEPDHTATVQPSDTTHRPIPPTHPEGGSPATNDGSSVTPKPSEDEDKPDHTVTVQPSDTTHRPHPPTQPENEVSENTPIIPTECPAVDGDFPVHIAHESDCTLFYKCAHGQKFEIECPAGLEFNAALQLCDWPEKAGCSLPGPATNDESSVTPRPPGDGNKPDHTATVPPSDTTHRPNPPTHPEGDGSGNTPIIPTECPAVDGDFPVHIAHESDCTLFYKCAHGEKFEIACPVGLEFNAALQLCDWPESAGCSLTGSATNDGSSVTPRPPGDGNKPDHTATVPPSDTTHRPNPPTQPEGEVPGNTPIVPTECPAEDGDFPVHIAHESDCTLFYKCAHGQKFEIECPVGLEFNAALQLCDWPEKAGCSLPGPATNDGSSVTPRPPGDGNKPDHTATAPPSDTTHRPNPPTHPEGDGSGNTPIIPTECPAVDGDFPVHIAHESDCTLFYKCAHGEKFEIACPVGLEFNAALQLCDWPESAGCSLTGSATNDGSSVTPRPPGDGNKPDHTATVPPSDTTHRPNPPTHPESDGSGSTPIIPTECPAVDGDFPVHIAHESDCTLFYKCAHGQKFEIECPAGLEFNAALQLCDWPESAGCSLPGSATNDESSVTPKPSEDEDKPHHTVTVQPSDTTHRPHPPTQPEGEVPGNTPIVPTECPAEDGDFPVHIAHESDCTLFYKCAHGQKFEIECPVGLEFNAALQLCDWPEKAGCSLPGPATNDGSSVTPRPPGDGNKPDHTATAPPSDTTHRPNPPTHPEGDGSGNTPIIPTECPAVDGDFPVHIAHESDCTLFYKCAHGEKFEIACPDGLEFNAVLQMCDWPETAGCQLTSKPPSHPGQPEYISTVQPPVVTSETPTSTEQPQYVSTVQPPVVTSEPPTSPKQPEYVPTGQPPIDSPATVTENIEWISTDVTNTADTEGSTVTDISENWGTSDLTSPSYGGSEVCDLSHINAQCPAVDPLDTSIYFPHAEPDKFCICSNGVPYVLICPDGLLFDSVLNVCNWSPTVTSDVQTSTSAWTEVY